MTIKKNRFTRTTKDSFDLVTFDALMQRSVPLVMAIATTEPIGSLQIRSMNIDPTTSTNRDWVEDLAAKIRRSPDLTPDASLVVAGVLSEAGQVVRYVRLDGNHYIAAYLQVAKERFLDENPKANDMEVAGHLAHIELPVKYVECTQVELESASYGTNAMHGLTLNNAEKVALARRMLAKYPHLADGAIEKLAPVLIAKTVGNQRKWMADPKNLPAVLKIVPHALVKGAVVPDNTDLKVEDGRLVFPSKRMGANGKWMETQEIGAKSGVPSLDEPMPDWAADTSDDAAPAAPTPVQVVRAEIVLSPEQQKAASRGKLLPAQAEGSLPEPSIVKNGGAKPAPDAAPKVSEQAEISAIPGGGKMFDFGTASFMVHAEKSGTKVEIDDGQHAVDIGVDVLIAFIKQYRAHVAALDIENIGK